MPGFQHIVARVAMRWAVWKASRRRSRMLIFQSSDRAYRSLLAVTSKVNIEYARRHGYAYCKCVGNLAPTPKTANFNRYYIIRQLIRTHRFWWAFFLDADALIVDHTRRLEDVVALSPRRMLIACRGEDHGPYDINIGVFFVNLSHPYALNMAQYVIDRCEQPCQTPSGWLSDQQFVHRWLNEHADASGEIPFLTRYAGEDASRFNYEGDFVHHVLRCRGTLAARLDELKRLQRQVLRTKHLGSAQCDEH
jgi:hypothetical protein